MTGDARPIAPASADGRGKLFRDIGSTFATQVAMMSMTLVSSIILARELQPTGKGLYSTATTLAAVTVALGSLGIGKAVLYRLARGGREVDPDTLRRTAFVVSSVNGLFVAGAMIVLALTARETLFPEVPREVLLAAAPICLVTIVRGAWEGSLRGEQRNQAVNGGGLVQAASFLVALASVAVAWGLTAGRAVWIRVAALTLAAAFGAWRLGWRKAGGAGRFDGRVAKSLALWGIPYAVAGAAQNVSYRLDILLVQGFQGSTEVGYYSISTALNEWIWYLPLAVGLVLFPRSAASSKEDADAEAAALMRWTFVIVACVIAFVLLAIEPIISVVFGSAYLPAADSWRLIALGALTNTWYLVLGSQLLGRGRVRALGLITVFGALLNLGLNLILIPDHGIEGAAVSSSVSYTVTGVLVLRMFLQDSGVPLRMVISPTPREVRQRLRAVSRRFL